MGYLKIDQTQALVGLKNNQPRVKLNIRPPILELQTSLPQFSIKQEGAKVYCDSSQARYEMGYKNPGDFSRDNAQKAKGDCLDYIAQVSRLGDMMASPAKYDNSDCIRAYARMGQDTLDYNVARLPRSLVDIRVTPPQLEMDLQMGDTRGNLQRGQVQVDSRQGKVDVYLRQKASLMIEYIDAKVDRYV